MPFNPNAPIDPSQVDDRRGRGGMGFGGPVAVGGGGIGVLFVIVAMLLGVNPFEGDTPYTYDQPRAAATSDQAVQECRIVGFVNSIQDYWYDEYGRRGLPYTPAKTVLFSGGVQAGCGFATEAQGPFYCPADQKIYLNLTFFQELQQRFGAQGGPFAEGYVVAHEYGHHIQNLSGLLDARGSNSASIQTELTADCLAGVWAHHASATGYLERPTDAEIATALDAAGAVGDDRIQKRMTGRVSPETWTHGSSAQRQESFAAGYQQGDPDACISG